MFENLNANLQYHLEKITKYYRELLGLLTRANRGGGKGVRFEFLMLYMMEELQKPKADTWERSGHKAKIIAKGALIVKGESKKSRIIPDL